MSVPQVTYSSLKSTVTSFCRNFHTTHSQSFCNPTGIPTGKKWTPKLQSDCLVKKQTNKDLDIAKKQWLSTAPWRQAVGEPVVSVYTWELAHKTAAHSRLLIRGGAPSTGKCACVSLSTCLSRLPLLHRQFSTEAAAVSTQEGPRKGDLTGRVARRLVFKIHLRSTPTGRNFA